MTRKLKPAESAIIESLLREPFPGRDELRAQIACAQVKPVESYRDNYGSLEFEVAAAPKAPVRVRVPVDAVALDADGVPIEFLLHVVDGVVKELEVVKADGSPIVKRPEASHLTVTAH